MDRNAFSFHDVVKDFRSREGAVVRALDGATFAAPAGGITCIVGPTGSGKSTVLRILSGLERPDTGAARVDGSDPASMTGRIGYLTQQHTLLPWMRVRQNIGLPLELKGLPAAERERAVASLCSLLGLTGAEDRYPHELSGGMQQRAALGRLLATETRSWLMDEPFSSLDERTRHQLQGVLVGLVRERGLSVLFVTHSIDEAVALADRIVVLSAGPGRVVETVDVALAHPRSRVAAGFGLLMERVRTAIESVL